MALKKIGRGKTIYDKVFFMLLSAGVFAALLVAPVFKISALCGTACACSSTDYNFHDFFITESVDCASLNYNPVSDSASRFCNLSSSALNKERQAPPDGKTSEIRVILKTPIFFETEIKYGDSEKEAAACSIENEIRSFYKQYGIDLLTQPEADTVFKAIGVNGSSAEIKILTPELMKKLNDDHSIYAVIDVSFYKLTISKHFQFNIKMTASDRRDLARNDRYDAHVRYKVTRCETGDIIWIDEVTGYSDDSFYYSLFEKGIMYNLKQICINESAL